MKVLLSLTIAGVLASSLRLDRAAASSGTPDVSPDGKHIAFGASRDGKRAAYVMDADGRGVVRVSGALDNAGAAGWTPDGRLFVATRLKDTTVLFVANLDGTSSPREVARVPGREPRVSPDGRSVLSVTGGYTATVFVVSSIDGSNPRPIPTAQGGSFNARWSPDGTRIAYTHLDAANDIGVWIMNADGSGAQLVSQGVPAGVRPQIPSWSPDGRRLAIQGNSVASGDTSKHLSHIWVLELASGAVTKLAGHSEPYLDEVPLWFPDGQRIAFQSDRTGAMQIWVMNADGTGAKALTP